MINTGNSKSIIMFTRFQHLLVTLKLYILFKLQFIFSLSNLIFYFIPYNFLKIILGIFFTS